MVAGDVSNARLVLQQAAEAGNATAALELGATYDPIELEKSEARAATALPTVVAQPAAVPLPRERPAEAPSALGVQTVASKALPNIPIKALPDIAMARTWYQKAKDLGSTEAKGRLENLANRDRPKR
jgi:TPR repeat protein